MLNIYLSLALITVTFLIFHFNLIQIITKPTQTCPLRNVGPLKPTYAEEPVSPHNLGLYPLTILQHRIDMEVGVVK